MKQYKVIDPNLPKAKNNQTAYQILMFTIIIFGSISMGAGFLLTYLNNRQKLQINTKIVKTT
ncbi:Uncharacterised protein [Mycoplasma putrefaciens]|uniref:hypothetical protein n=1 Tax=Mycoplasma putrefaciens TaxID=2123 RepID=UPI0002E8C60E|nr:hypothetical protein [Mycoplasma putrefaciens]SYV94792.1 Uncharacterised protein [Mycoplasma putrefaciens]